MTDLSPRFWTHIDRARAASTPAGASADPDALADVLGALTDEEVAEFLREFTAGLCHLNRWDVWGAGFMIERGMGGDGFHYFRSWILGKGRDAYLTALRDPDALGDFVLDDEVAENELLEYVALEVLEERGVDGDPRDRAEGNPDDTPRGEGWDEDTVGSRFPRLAARFGGE